MLLKTSQSTTYRKIKVWTAALKTQHKQVVTCSFETSVYAYSLFYGGSREVKNVLVVTNFKKINLLKCLEKL